MKNTRVLTWTGGGGSPAEPASILCDPCVWTTQSVRKQSQEVVSEHQFYGNYEQSSARRAKPRFRPQARALASIAKGGEPLSRPTESGAIHCDPSAWTKSRAFTMAEILLSLTIIGVVAAITLPSLTGNINERTWNTQRKALYSRLSQAVALMPALNGYGTLTGTISADGTQTITEDNAAETFITSGLAKVLKINNICDSEHLTDCGIPDKIVPMQGRYSSVTNIALSSIKTLADFNPMFNFSDTSAHYSYRGQLITKAAAFETANGESILTYYSPTCRSDDSSSFRGKYVQPFMCANFVYDLNGKKGPNTVGKDIGFISVLYPSDSVVVAPLPVIGAAIGSTFDDASRKCREKDEIYRVPNFEELAAIFYNKLLVGENTGDGVDYWSSKRADNGLGWLLKLRSGTYVTWDRGASLKCIQR